MTTLSAPEALAIPASHLDLLTRPICGVLTTMDGDGQPQSSLVWVDWDGACAQVNTTLERHKGRNLLANPKVSLLVVDPDNPGRYLQVRGDAELVTDGALAHLDALTRKYTRHPAYYGHIYPVAQRWRETRVTCRIHARRITLDAIHARARSDRCTEEAPAKPADPEAYGVFGPALGGKMSATAPDAPLPQLEARLAHPPDAASFDQGELQGLPDPVCRYLRASIATGTPLARSARLGMRGSVKLGRWWIPFRARQVFAPHQGLVWIARVGGVVEGFDGYTDGQGAMQWTLLGLIRLLHAQGPDVSRSAAGRVAAEAVWVPTALLPRFGVTWQAADAHHLTASYRLDDVELEVHYTLDDDARVRSVALDRWGDPESSGTFGFHRFGHELTRYSTFDGVMIPSAGRAGWFYGTDRWSEGEFFRYEFTDFHLVTPASSAG